MPPLDDAADDGVAAAADPPGGDVPAVEPAVVAPGVEEEAGEDRDAQRQPVYTVSAVARRLGIAPSTLRTWDRRYGLGPSAHTAGSHRRYSPADVGRLVVMRELTLDGVPPAEAAQLALTEPTVPPVDTAALPSLVHDVPTPTEPAATSVRWPGRGAASDGVAAVPDSAALPGTGWNVVPWPDEADLYRDPDDVFDPGALPRRSTGVFRGAPNRPGGGRVVALPTGTPQTRGLARAAMSLDTLGVARLIREAIRAQGVVEAWESNISPVLLALGERWRTNGDAVDVEHAFSEALLGVVRGVAGNLRGQVNPRPVLLSCAEGDLHTLPLHVLAAALAEADVGCRMLGYGMPAPALVAAVRRCGPAVVFLYARLPVGDIEVLEALPRQRPAPRVIVGGPGWDDADVPPSVQRVATLRAAKGEVLGALQV